MVYHFIHATGTKTSTDSIGHGFLRERQYKLDGLHVAQSNSNITFSGFDVARTYFSRLALSFKLFGLRLDVGCHDLVLTVQVD